jgi:hypothetical protein
VGKLHRRGTNKSQHYKYPRATDVFKLVRGKLLDLGVLILPSEEPAEYVSIPTNGGEQVTECRLYVTYLITDGTDSLPPIKANGVGRDIEDKGLYKAKTGAEKYLVKQLALMVEIVDDPEWDGAEHENGETLDDVAPMRSPSRKREQPIRDFEVAAIENACADTNKAPAEIAEVMCTRFKADTVAGLKRYQFKEALAWASNGAGTLAPKPQAAPALQGSLPLPKLVPSFEMRVGGKTEVIQPKTGSYSV